MTTRRGRLRDGCRTLAFLLLVGTAPCAGYAQETSGSTPAALGGAALGLYSGAVFGVLGSFIPCSQTYAGATCVRVATATAAAIGMAGGIALGHADAAGVGDRAAGAGIGALVGLGVGLALKPAVQRYGWHDVAAIALAAGGIGVSPKGAVIGLGIGTGVGLALWQLLPAFELPNALAAGLAGMAIGGIGALLHDGVQRHGSDPVSASLAVPFISLRF